MLLSGETQEILDSIKIIYHNSRDCLDQMDVKIPQRSTISLNEAYKDGIAVNISLHTNQGQIKKEIYWEDIFKNPFLLIGLKGTQSLHLGCLAGKHINVKK